MWYVWALVRTLPRRALGGGVRTRPSASALLNTHASDTTHTQSVDRRRAVAAVLPPGALAGGRLGAQRAAAGTWKCSCRQSMPWATSRPISSPGWHHARRTVGIRMTAERLFWHCGAHTAEPKLGARRAIPPIPYYDRYYILLCSVARGVIVARINWRGRAAAAVVVYGGVGAASCEPAVAQHAY